MKGRKGFTFLVGLYWGGGRESECLLTLLLGTLALNSGHSATGRGPQSWASVLPPHADKEAAVTRVISTDLTRGLSISCEPGIPSQEMAAS